MARETGLNEYVTADGEHFETYQRFCSGVYLGFLFLMIMGGFSNIYRYKKGDASALSYLTPLLSVFGLLLFLVMWEAHARYITNYIPLIYISAAVGMEYLSNIRIKLFLK